MFRAVLSLLVMMTASVGWANDLDDVHPKDRAAVEALAETKSWIRFDEQGRAVRLIASTWGDNPLTNAHMPWVAKLTELRELDLSSSSVTDAGLAHLKGLGKLRRLGLSEGSSNFALSHVVDFWTKFIDRDIQVHKSHVSDKGMAHFVHLTELEELDLAGADISDQGLKALGAFKKLKVLTQAMTDVT